MDGDTRKRIAAVVAANPRGLTITEVGEKVDVTRQTASKHLERLKEAGRVEERRVGQAKLHYPTGED